MKNITFKKSILFILVLLFLMFIQKTDVARSSNLNVDLENTDLIQYVYFETDDSKANLQFFLTHALHDKADFLFIINGAASVEFPTKKNIRILKRNNTCLDLGTHGIALSLPRKKQYKRIMLINASVRGPFIPRWFSNCWSDIFFGKLNEKTKLVGTTPNCDKTPHLQSMILAFDSLSIEIVLPALACFSSLLQAVESGELRLTKLVQDAGYTAEPIMTRPFNWLDCNNNYESDEYVSDLVYPGNYGVGMTRTPRQTGLSIHPFDTIFIKTKRFPNDDPVILHYTSWMEGYSSYDHC